MTYDSGQLSRIGLAYHQGQGFGCPECGSQVYAEACGYAGKVSEDVHFWCPSCGASGRFEPVDATEAWSAEECASINRDYMRQGVALCPKDLAKVRAVPSHSDRQGPPLNYSCPYCGRSHDLQR